MKKAWWLLLVLVALSICAVAPAKAALYWFAGVRDASISVCFVGDALTARPDRVQQILAYIDEFEYGANIEFDYLGTCPAPTRQGNGDDFHNGDIRVVIPNTNVSGSGPVPGKGCPMFDQMGPNGYDGNNDGWGSWSNTPNDLAANRACLYNLKLGDDPWNDTPYLNHTLHEFGHALGLSHEHQRADAACYNPQNDTRGATQGYMTPYDVESVMHYAFSTAVGDTCDTPGNYGNTGLSAWDRLGLHILYPEEARIAEFVGTTVVRTTDPLNLRSAWKVRGADLGFVASNFVWKVDGNTLSTTPELVTTISKPGTYTLAFEHDDFLGRHYAYTGKVKVLTPEAYDRLMASMLAINQPLFTGDTTHEVPKEGGAFVLNPATSIKLSQGIFAKLAVIRYRPLHRQETGKLADVGVFFAMAAVDPLNGEEVAPQAGKTYTLKVGYQESSIPEGVQEENLALYYRGDAVSAATSEVASDWVREETSRVDTEANSVTATSNHFGQWAILAGTEESIYLPLVMQ